MRDEIKAKHEGFMNEVLILWFPIHIKNLKHISWGSGQLERSIFLTIHIFPNF